MPRPAAPTKRAARPARSRSARPGPSSLALYCEQTSTPLTSLLFVVPLLVLHEWGVQRFGTLAGGGVEHRVTAFSLLTRFLRSLGASGHYLPALAVVFVLLGIHLAHRDRWVFHIPL